MLRKPKSQELTNKNKSFGRNKGSKLEEKISSWAIAKNEIAEMQKKAFLEEYAEKLAHLKKMNRLEEMYKIEGYEIEKAFTQKEQALKLKLLEVQIDSYTSSIQKVVKK
ncbi:hypothetical protein ABEB36_009572 [Hypothenemus hampei]|uniref:Uncharacterized protein n=1 Tax=Hypothenemus hampei TaxID=57062 RepID=A0ABD1EGV3_HYPHA